LRILIAVGQVAFAATVVIGLAFTAWMFMRLVTQFH
jgi:hypothetical protein